jgi:hypothetical protein
MQFFYNTKSLFGTTHISRHNKQSQEMAYYGALMTAFLIADSYFEEGMS